MFTINQQTRSLIRHILTALGLLIAALGLGEWSGLIDLFSNSLDAMIAAIETIGGFVLMVYGFFKDRDRHIERASAEASTSAK